MPMPLAERLGQVLRLAARNLVRQPRRTLLSLLIISGGVAAFLLASGFMHWGFNDLRESTIHAQLGHAQVTRPGYFEQGLADPYDYLLPGDSSPVTAAAEVPIRTVTPRLAFNGLLSSGEDTVSFIGEGVDPPREALVARAIHIIEGRDLTDSPTDSVILGQGLAASIGAAPGDRVVLLANTAQGRVNAVELTVAGIFNSVTKAYDDVALRAPIEVARSLMRVEGDTSWVVLLDSTDDTDRAVADLRRRLPADEFEVVPWIELADFYRKSVQLLGRQVDVMRILIGLIVILSISNSLMMTVVERTSEIGTCLAVGVRRRGIMVQFAFEGLLLGIVGGIVGVLLGLVLGAAISAVGIPMPPAPGMARGYVAEILISPALAFDGFLLGAVTTLLAGLFPAWKASRLNIVDALRQQR